MISSSGKPTSIGTDSSRALPSEPVRRPSSPADYRAKRLSRIKNSFSLLGLDALLVRHLPRIRYISGFSGSSGIVVLSGRNVFLLVDSRYTTQARQEAPSVQIREIERPWEEAVSRFLREIRAERIGYETERMSVAMGEDLRRRCPQKIQWTAQNDWLETLRSVKDPDEIEVLRKAADLASQACCRLMEWLKPGIAELDVVAELEYWMRRQGAEKLSFDPIVASGPRSSCPHARATRQKLPEKGWVMVDFGALYDGYSSDMTRTFHLGRPSPQSARRYRAVQEAQWEAIQSLHPGVYSDTPYLSVRKHLQRYRLDKCFTHALGHGIGLELHERPSLSSNNRELLKTGMVMTVEPGIYLPNREGIRIEDMVLLKETGPELLTEFTRDLPVL